MRVSHVCPFVGEQMGGSERYVYNLSKRQARTHDVHIYTTTKHASRVGTSESNGCTIHRFYSPLAVWNINPIAMMIKPLMDSGSDLFHIHSYLYTLSNQAILAKIVKKKKALLQIHGGVGLPPYKTNWLKIAAKHLYDASLGRFTIKHSDLVASVSYCDLDSIASQFSVPKSRLRYVPNTVDTSMFLPKKHRDTDRKTLLYVGDLEPWKGVGSLINWLHARHQWDEFSFRVRFVGQGSLFNHLKKLQLELRDNENKISIEVLGARRHAEMPALMRSADALILPSYWEGMPTVILEAMASGTLVISTRVGDIPRYISHLNTGLLIDRSLVSFREAVRTVLRDRENVRNIIENARELAEREFSLSHVDRVLQGHYSDLCQSTS